MLITLQTKLLVRETTSTSHTGHKCIALHNMDSDHNSSISRPQVLVMPSKIHLEHIAVQKIRCSPSLQQQYNIKSKDMESPYFLLLHSSRRFFLLLVLAAGLAGLTTFSGSVTPRCYLIINCYNTLGLLHN